MLIYGTNPVREALKADRKVYEIFYIKNSQSDILLIARNHNIKTTEMTKGSMDKKFGKNHQNIAANVEDYTFTPLKDAISREGKKLFIMLDGVEDPHNLGAVIRNADAFGASGVIIPKHRSAQITPTVVKVSTGAIEYVSLIRVTNLNQAIRTLKENNIWVVGLELDTDETLEDIYVDLDMCLVFGSEGKGISRLVRENCDYLVKIPMQGTVNSLNISVSSGVALHDITKRRRS